jgi:hypothetical protein
MADRFSIVFKASIKLTLFCGFVAGGIALLAQEPHYLSRIFDTCVGLFMAGVGAVLALIGSASQSVNGQEQKDPPPL